MSKYFKNEYILFFSLFFLLWLLILVPSGSITAGYQLIDDNIILEIKKKLLQLQNQQGFALEEYSCLFSYEGRFLPFHVLQRFLKVLFFGTNHLYHSVYIGFLAVLTSFFMFLFARVAKFSKFESTVFVLVALLGPQVSIWFELGRAENTAMFSLSVSLFLMALSVFSQKHVRLYKILFVISAIILTLQKESFIIFIPAAMFLLLWLYKDYKKYLLELLLKKICLLY